MSNIINFPSPPEYKEKAEAKLQYDRAASLLIPFIVKTLDILSPSFATEEEINHYNAIITNINIYLEIEGKYKGMLNDHNV